MSKTASILAVRNGDVGFIPLGATPLKDMGVFEIPEIWAGPRQAMEADAYFRQLIPYVLVRKGDEFLTYTRGATGGEDRLHGQLSIGVGGHVDTRYAQFDNDGRVNFTHSVYVAACREIEEEIGVYPGITSLRMLGFIKTSDNPVDEVHLGLVMAWDASEYLAKGNVFKFEDTLEAPRWMTKGDLRATNMGLESWTKYALDLI